MAKTDPWSTPIVGLTHSVKSIWNKAAKQVGNKQELFYPERNEHYSEWSKKVPGLIEAMEGLSTASNGAFKFVVTQNEIITNVPDQGFLGEDHAFPMMKPGVVMLDKPDWEEGLRIFIQEREGLGMSLRMEGQNVFDVNRGGNRSSEEETGYWPFVGNGLNGLVRILAIKTNMCLKNTREAIKASTLDCCA